MGWWPFSGERVGGHAAVAEQPGEEGAALPLFAPLGDGRDGALGDVPQERVDVGSAEAARILRQAFIADGLDEDVEGLSARADGLLRLALDAAEGDLALHEALQVVLLFDCR